MSGLNNGDLDGGANNGDGAVCAATEVTLTKMKPKVLLLLDQSGSMQYNNFGGKTRWAALKDVLLGPNLATGGLVKQLQGEAEIGMEMYSATDDDPNDNDSSSLPGAVKVCPRFNGKAFDGTTYALNSAAAIEAALRNTPVDDDTPTGPAIRKVVGIGNDGKINDSKGFAALKTEAPKVIVLVTDGEPGVCKNGQHGVNDPSDAARTQVVDAVKQTFAQKIKTFVIAIGAASATAHFNEVASAGQGKPAKAIQPTTTDDLVKAISTIVNDARTCSFKLDGEVPEGQERTGTVTLNGAPVPFDEPGAPDEGWRMVDRSRIELVGSACTTLKTKPDAKLEAKFPCGVVLPISVH